jgi:hypothetical protein
MTIAAPTSRNPVGGVPAVRMFHRFIVSYWPRPNHRERVEVEVPAGAESREAALLAGARKLGRPVGEVVIGWGITVTRRCES